MSETRQHRFWRTSEDHGFHDALAHLSPGHQTIVRLCLIHSEASEALEEVRDDVDLAAMRYRVDGKPEGVPSELADIIIRTYDLAECLGFDLDAAVEEKAAFNEGRPYMHGQTV